LTIFPNLKTAECVCKNGEKYFELICEPVQQEILPGVFLRCYGYNGSTPGPAIICCPGDCVNIRIVNKLPEETSCTWVGVNTPNRMDGIPNVEPTPVIRPGDYYDYRFTVPYSGGTHFYQSGCNAAYQIPKGCVGPFVILDRSSSIFNRDYCLTLQEFSAPAMPTGAVKAGVFDIDPFANSFNFFCLNGKCYPNISALDVASGDACRIRLCNPSCTNSTMHLNGHQFVVVSNDGNAAKTRDARNTISCAAGQTCDIALNCDNPGYWPFANGRPLSRSNNKCRELGGMCTTLNYL